jgi:hypothetical protein
LAAPLLPVDDEALLPLPPLLLPLLEADFLLPPAELLPEDLLLVELLPALPDAAFRAVLPLEPVPFLRLAADLLLPDIADDDPGPPVILFIAESEAPTTAPVAAPATISPTRSFALS